VFFSFFFSPQQLCVRSVTRPYENFQDSPPKEHEMGCISLAIPKICVKVFIQ
ncbi:hypothetical protein L9F63_020860, partial [Diploptera punctata]